MNDSDYLTPDERDDMAVLSNVSHGLGPLHVADLIVSHAVADDLLRKLRDDAREYAICGCLRCHEKLHATLNRIDAVLNPEPASECARCGGKGTIIKAVSVLSSSCDICPDCNGTGKKEKA